MKEDDMQGPEVAMKERAITYTWKVTETNAAGEYAEIVLRVSHDKNMRAYRATLSRGVVESRPGGYKVTRHSLYRDDAGRPTAYGIKKVSVDRYNAKKLQLLAGEIVTGIEKTDEFQALLAASRDEIGA